MVWKTSSGLQDFGLFVVTGTPIIATFFVFLRYLSKHRSSGIAVEDHLLAIAAVFAIVIIYPSWRWIKMWNYGIHVWEVDPKNIHPDFDEYYKLQIVFNMFTNPILPLVKASILIVLLKIGGFLWPVYISGWVLFIFNALACIIPEFFLLFQCPELAGFKWKARTFGGAHCLGRIGLGRLNIFQVSVSMFTDLLVFPIPIYLAWKLDILNVKTRMRVLLLFSLSLFVTILGGLRIWFTYRDRLRTFDQPSDWTWWNIRFVVQHAENSLAIIFACVPSLKTLFSGCCGMRRRHGVDEIPEGPDFDDTEMGDHSKPRSWIRRMSEATRSPDDDLKEIISVTTLSRDRTDYTNTNMDLSQQSRVTISVGSSTGI